MTITARRRPILAVVSILVMAALTVAALPAHAAGSLWAGYGWPGNTRVSCDFTIPNVTGSNGQAVAFWAGIGQGDPGIQQAGVTGTVGSGFTAWWEAWPAAAHQFNPPTPPHSGDVMQFIVTRSGTAYTMAVNDVTRGWQQSATATYASTEPGGEAIAEQFAGTLPNFGQAKFYSCNGTVGSDGAWSIAGTTKVITSASSFYVSKP